jgi:hypothetical protein
VPDGKRSSAEEGLAAGCAPGAEGASKSSLELGPAAAGAGGLGTSKSSALVAAGAGVGVAAAVAGVAAAVAGVAVAGACVGLCAQLRRGVARAKEKTIRLRSRRFGHRMVCRLFFFITGRQCKILSPLEKNLLLIGEIVKKKSSTINTQEKGF